MISYNMLQTLTLHCFPRLLDIGLHLTIYRHSLFIHVRFRPFLALWYIGLHCFSRTLLNIDMLLIGLLLRVYDLVVVSSKDTTLIIRLMRNVHWVLSHVQIKRLVLLFNLSSINWISVFLVTLISCPPEARYYSNSLIDTLSIAFALPRILFNIACYDIHW